MSNKYDQLDLKYPLPEKNAQQFPLATKDFWLLCLYGLRGLWLKFTQGDTPLVGVASVIAVTGTVTVVAAASTTGRKCVVYNNSPTNDVVLLEGGSPKFVGQESSLVDIGIVLHPGDYWECPTCSASIINARCRTSEVASLTKITYARP